MKLNFVTNFSLAAFSLAVLLPCAAQTATTQTSNDTPPVAASADSMRMMPAQAVLKETIDASKAAPGSQFRVNLTNAVHLNNGQTLPNGTLLVGEVVSDDTITTGAPKLALRFTQAVLKNGQTVPIKATIVGLAQSGDLETTGNAVSANAVPSSWNDGTLKVDQASVATGLELHSRAASDNSGVILSSKKKDVKLSAGYEMALAISSQTNDQPISTTSSDARR